MAACCSHIQHRQMFGMPDSSLLENWSFDMVPVLDIDCPRRSHFAPESLSTLVAVVAVVDSQVGTFAPCLVERKRLLQWHPGKSLTTVVAQVAPLIAPVVVAEASEASVAVGQVDLVPMGRSVE